MCPYSIDLRERMVAAIDRGEHSLRQISHLFSVNLSFLVRLRQRRRATGSVQPKPHGAGLYLPATAPNDATSTISRLLHSCP